MSKTKRSSKIPRKQNFRLMSKNFPFNQINLVHCCWSSRRLFAAAASCASFADSIGEGKCEYEKYLQDFPQSKPETTFWLGSPTTQALTPVRLFLELTNICLREEKFVKKLAPRSNYVAQPLSLESLFKSRELWIAEHSSSLSSPTMPQSAHSHSNPEYLRHMAAVVGKAREESWRAKFFLLISFSQFFRSLIFNSIAKIINFKLPDTCMGRLRAI